MSVIKLMTFIFFLCSVALPANALAASFNCKTATAPTDRLICGYPTLSSLDSKMGAIYKKVIQKSANPKKIKQAQLAWLRQRNECNGDVNCIQSEYQSRLRVLSYYLWVHEKDRENGPYELIMSKNTPLCQSMLNIYNTDVRKYGEIKYKTHKQFQKIKWKTIKSLKGVGDYTPLKASFDIDNDGKSELVIKWTSSAFYALIDTLYIYPEKSNVISTLHEGQNGLEPLFADQNKILTNDMNHPYDLWGLTSTDIDKILSEKLRMLSKSERKKINKLNLRNNIRNATIGPSYIIEPFIWHGTTYISITDEITDKQEWIVISKYTKQRKMNDICYFHDSRNKRIR